MIGYVLALIVTVIMAFSFVKVAANADRIMEELKNNEDSPFDK